MNSTLEEARASVAESVTERMEEFVSPGAVRAAKDKTSEEQLQRADAALQQLVPRTSVSTRTALPPRSTV